MIWTIHCSYEIRWFFDLWSRIRNAEQYLSKSLPPLFISPIPFENIRNFRSFDRPITRYAKNTEIKNSHLLCDFLPVLSNTNICCKVIQRYSNKTLVEIIHFPLILEHLTQFESLTYANVTLLDKILLETNPFSC